VPCPKDSLLGAKKVRLEVRNAARVGKGIEIQTSKHKDLRTRALGIAAGNGSAERVRRRVTKDDENL
jgi:hypothetical protein